MATRMQALETAFLGEEPGENAPQSSPDAWIAGLENLLEAAGFLAPRLPETLPGSDAALPSR
jgi:hypothetical protein